MSVQVPPSDLYLARARASVNSKDCMDIYDKWAATYNDEVGHEDQGYVAPLLVAQAALNASSNATNNVILDAGCGTGLVGQALALAGPQTIDGLDLSDPMLKIAEQTGVYRNLAQADLTKPINQIDNTYDIVTCVGTFTLGHVGPDPAMRELVRVIKNNGVVVATILDKIWLAHGFKTEVDKMQAEGLVTVVNDGLVDYVKGHGDKAVLLVLRKTDRA